MSFPTSFCARCLCCALVTLSSLSWAQTAKEPAPSKNWRVERDRLSQPFQVKLQKLAGELAEAGDQRAARTVLAEVLSRDLERQFIFVPDEASATIPNADWEKQLKTLKETHAENLFDLAKSAAEQGAGATAFQLLHETIYFNPDHEQVRGILGHTKTEKGWRISSDRIRAKKGTQIQKIMQWKKKTYVRVTTPHFVIDSTASEEKTIELAKKLERWHDVWRQVFFEFWSNSTTVNRWIQGKGKARKSTRRFQVVFFADQESYVRELEPIIPGIGVSTGYYSDQEEASFFYDSNDLQIQETWRHELTHQLFQESIRSTKGPFRNEFVWLGEGIAMYFESLQDFGKYVTLGGFDSRRLQFSRIRVFREGFFVELDAISQMPLQAFQTDRNVRRLYSQSAGMCHFLMNGDQGNHQQNLLEFLKLMYMGKLRQGTFSKIIRLDNKSFRKGYRNYLETKLNVIDEHWRPSKLQTELSTGNSELTGQSFEKIGQCTELRWLDLTGNSIRGEDLKKLRPCRQLTQLFLSKCRIEDGALGELKSLEQLEEVDLTVSDVSDAQFLELADCARLKSVTISGTSITNEAISLLKRQLPGLEVQK